MMYTEISRFEWDDVKAQRNALKHGITFKDAATSFQDPEAMITEDTAHSQQEQRQRLIGESIQGRLLIVVFTLRNEGTGRIISARPANRKERKNYEKKRRISF